MKVRRVGATFLLLAVLAGLHGLTSLWSRFSAWNRARVREPWLWPALLGTEALFVLARNRIVFTPEAVAMLDTAPPPPRDQMGIVGRTSVLLVLAATIALFAYLAFYA
jgi:hypothetical protein